MALSLYTGPTTEPVSVEEARLHVRQDGTSDDDVIRALITASRENVEQITRRALITQTWDYYLNAFPFGDRIEMPLPPLVSVTHIKYTDDAGVQWTMSSSDYIVDTYSHPGQVVLADGASWPSASLQPVNGVVTRFVAGYGDADDVPYGIKAAIKLMIGHLYENREASLASRSVQVLPFGIESLLASYRVYGW